MPAPRFSPGDRVVFNANLDKRPDPENASIVGTIVRYVGPGESLYVFGALADIVLVDWAPDVQPLAISDDWLEPAPT